MQAFNDSATGKMWAFEDDVKVIDNNGVYSFETAQGVTLNVPKTLKPYTPPKLTAAQKLSNAKAANADVIKAAAIQAQDAPLTIKTTGGVTATFYMDANARSLYMGAYVLYVVQGKPLPSGFAFDDKDGVAVPMTLADLEAFATAFDKQVYGAISKKADLLAKNAAASSQTAVKSITW